MRKILSLILIPFAALTLCSCFDYIEIEKSYIISALGFDMDENAVRLSVEVANGGEKRIFEAVGETILEAFQNIKKGFTRKPDFSHTACIVLGENFTQNMKYEALQFLKDVEGFAISARIVTAENALNLLENEPRETAIGYDIIKLLEQNKVESIKLYETMDKKITTLPLLGFNEQGVFLLKGQVKKK